MRLVTRSLGTQLPDSVRQLLDGMDLAQREGLTFLLLTNDEDDWPQVAMLSVGEVVAIDARTLHAGLWLHSGTSKNLTRSGRATLVMIADGNGYYVRLSARRGQDLDLRAPWPHAGGLRSFASSGDRLVQALEVRAHDLRAQARDQLSHATPAWRPARSPSRR